MEHATTCSVPAVPRGSFAARPRAHFRLNLNECLGNDFIAQSGKSSAVTSEPTLAFIAAAFSTALAAAAVLRNRRSGAAWWFAVGMVGLAVDSVLSGICLSGVELNKLAR